MTEHGPRFWIAVVAGGAVMAFGVQGALGDMATRPPQLFVWMVGADLLHDLVLAPAVGAAGYLVQRFVREPWRTPVRAGLIVSGIVALVGWPAWRGYGRDHVPDNPSVLPIDYTTSILTVLAVVWAAVALWAVARRARLGRSGVAYERDRLVEERAP